MPIDLLSSYHPIIGIVVLVLLFFQPITGFVHHLRFKKLGKRTAWSYVHVWLGRVGVTLGMVNGGLGLLLASDAPAFTGFKPSRGQVVAYGVVAAGMWVVWVVAAVVGERRRKRGGEVVRGKEGEDVEESGTPPPYGEVNGYVLKKGWGR